MRLTNLLAHDCPTGGTCPRIIDTDGDDVIVQGATVTDPDLLAELDMPAHESAVRAPRTLIYDVKILDVDELGQWLSNNHSRDLFRLEVRDAYAVDSDGDDYRRYLSGEGEPDAAAKAPWLEQLAADTAAGRIWRKVHLVHGPLSDYERYEIEWGFLYNATAGEQCRILEVDGARAKQLDALGDFFVLDGEHVLRNLYDEYDRFLGGQPIYGGEAAALRAVIDWVWDAAEPVASWWDRHPEYHRGNRA